MLVAQLTDLHLGFEGQTRFCSNTERLKTVISTLKNLKRQPDLVLVTGDLVESGESWAYEKLKTELDDMPWPYFVLPGNHDKSAGLREIFGHYGSTPHALQYTIEDWPCRIIMLDSLEEGRHGGHFDEAKAQWLDETLAEQSDRPTLLALHHAPIVTGIPWMTSQPEAEWVVNLTNIVAKHPQIVKIICGHIHRPISAQIGNCPVFVSPSVAPEVSLELADLSLDEPDHRPMISDTAPSFSLHLWDRQQIVSHSMACPAGKSLLSFDQNQIKTIRHTLDLD